MTTLGARLRAIPTWQVTLGLALLVLGFLIAAQLASEGPRVRYTSQERAPLLETALDLTADQEALRTRILELRARIGELEVAGQGSAVLARELNDELEEARVVAGLVALSGEGIVLLVEDSDVPPPDDGTLPDYLVSAADLLTIVDELWLAGAEAIAINTERITAVSAIVDIGGSVLVNSAYLAPPYQVSAIGPPTLLERLTASRGFADFLQARSAAYGIRVQVAEPEVVEVPAYAGSVNLRYGRPVVPEPGG